MVLMAMASASQAQTVHLAWDPPADGRATSYVIEWGPMPGGYRTSRVVPAGVTRFETPPLQGGLRYYFAVRAVDAEGRKSGFSNEVSVVVPATTTVPRADAVPDWETTTVTVVVAGSGRGHVASSPEGIACGGRCSVTLPTGTPVTLAATPAPGSRFVGWEGGGCSGAGTCALNADAARAVVARFEADPARSPASYTRYLAEGAASAFFDTRVVLANPGGTPAHASLSFLRGDGVVVPYETEVAPLSSQTVFTRSLEALFGHDFSTIVRSDVPLVVDRTMTWGGTWGMPYGSHAESALAEPSARWYLAEGATHHGFDLFYLLQNPGDATVPARIRYLRPAGPPIEKTYWLAPRSRTSIWVDQETFGDAGRLLADTEVSAVVESLDGAGIVVERAMYDTRGPATFQAGHESAGITTPAARWYFAEGATGPYFDMFLLLANPSPHDADVAVTYLLPDGTQVRRRHRVGASQRYTIWVDREGEALADTAVSAIVEAVNGVPVVAERSMWWPGDSRTWHEAHTSPGATEPGIAWAVADGSTRAAPLPESTYLLVANPSAGDAEVRVTVLFGGGLPTVSRTFHVAAASRFGLSIGDAFPEAMGQRFGALVESIGPDPVPIVVERAMYGDAPRQPWANGSNLLATRLR